MPNIQQQKKRVRIAERPVLFAWGTADRFFKLLQDGKVTEAQLEIFEALRTVASQYAPNVWQMSLGIGMLVIIMFLPSGLWSLARRRPAG